MELPKEPHNRITARVKRETVIRLSQRDAQTILSLLDHPPEPNECLKEAVRTSFGACRVKR